LGDRGNWLTKGPSSLTFRKEAGAIRSTPPTKREIELQEKMSIKVTRRRRRPQKIGKAEVETRGGVGEGTSLIKKMNWGKEIKEEGPRKEGDIARGSPEKTEC